MRKVLWYKFTQHSSLFYELLSTSDAELIEVCTCWYYQFAFTNLVARTHLWMLSGGLARMGTAETSWEER